MKKVFIKAAKAEPEEIKKIAKQRVIFCNEIIRIIQIDEETGEIKEY